MANQTPLATWLYSKREELNPKFMEFNWPKQWRITLFDFSTTVTWNGMTAEGRGVDEKREVALEKSVAEALERLICINHKIESVGLAVAGTTFDPTDHARNEALERFYLRQHIRYQVPFSKIDESHSLANEFMQSHHESKVSFYRMKTSPELFGVVCLMTSNKIKKSSVGFALSRNLENSLKRSVLEALPSFAWLVDSKNDPNESFTLPWHIRPEFLNQIFSLLRHDSLNDSSFELESPQLKQIEISLRELSILSTAPVRVARFVANVAIGSSHEDSNS